MNLQYPQRMSNQYTLQKDLNDRLDGTVCRYDGRVVRVYAQNKTLELYDFLGKKAIRSISPNDPLFDISAIETGYFNYASKMYHVMYLTRDPIKKYKAALYHSYVKYLTIDGAQSMVMMPEGLYSQGVLDSLEGRFPTYAEALLLLPERGAVAISQDIALRRGPIGETYVYYRCTAIGWMAPAETKVHLIDSDLRWVVQRHLARVGLTI